MKEGHHDHYREILLRLVLATALGAIIGYEESTNHYAGLRTHMLVSVALLIGLVNCLSLNNITRSPWIPCVSARSFPISVWEQGHLKHGSTISSLTTAESEEYCRRFVHRLRCHRSCPNGYFHLFGAGFGRYSTMASEKALPH